MKNFILGAVTMAAVIALSMVISQEIIDYIQYQQVLKMKEALINL